MCHRDTTARLGVGGSEGWLASNWCTLYLWNPPRWHKPLRPGVELTQSSSKTADLGAETCSFVSRWPFPLHHPIHEWGYGSASWAALSSSAVHPFTQEAAETFQFPGTAASDAISPGVLEPSLGLASSGYSGVWSCLSDFGSLPGGSYYPGAGYHPPPVESPTTRCEVWCSGHSPCRVSHLVRPEGGTDHIRPPKPGYGTKRPRYCACHHYDGQWRSWIGRYIPSTWGSLKWSNQGRELWSVRMTNDFPCR